MASIKISELEEVVTLSEGDTLPIINEGDTKQVSITKLGDIFATKEYVDSSIPDIPESGGGEEVPKIENPQMTDMIQGDSFSSYIFVDNLKKLLTEYRDKMLYQFDMVNTDGGSMGTFVPKVIRFTLTSLQLHQTKLSEMNQITYSATILNPFVPCELKKFNITCPVNFEGEGGAYNATPTFSIPNKYRFLPIDNSATYNPTSNYHPATKKYVDDSIASIEIPESGGATESLPTYVFNTSINPKGSTVFLPESDRISLMNLLNQIISDGNASNYQILIKSSVYPYLNIIVDENYSDYPYHLSELRANVVNYGFMLTGTMITGANDGVAKYERFQLSFSYDSDANKVITGIGSSAYISYFSSNIIHTTNTVSFTPTKDYHPATKKYVDDAIANIDIPESGGSEELVSHYYLTINSSSKDFYDNPYDSLSGRTEEMITLCNNVYTDMKSGITPLLHLRYDYRAPIGLTTRYQITMELDGQGLSSIDASTPFVFKHITRVKTAFKDVIHGHELRISYNASSNQITSMSFSGNSVEYATKEYVDSQIKTSITSVLEADY